MAAFFVVRPRHNATANHDGNSPTNCRTDDSFVRLQYRQSLNKLTLTR